MIIFRRLLELPKYALAGMIGGLIVVGMGGYTVYVQNTTPHLSATAVEISPSPPPDISPSPIPTDIPTPTAEPVIPTIAPIAAPIIAPTIAPVTPTVAPIIPTPIPTIVPIPPMSVSLNLSSLKGNTPLTVSATANFLNMPANFTAQLTINGLVCNKTGASSVLWSDLVLQPLSTAELQTGQYYDFTASSSNIASQTVRVTVCPAAGCAYSSVGPASTASIKC